MNNLRVHCSLLKGYLLNYLRWVIMGEKGCEGVCAELKIMIQSIVLSFIIHVVYLIGTVGAAYIQTITYKPDFDNEWENVHILQSEVAFGMAGSSLYFLFTFIGTAVISGLLIMSFRKIVSLK